MSLEEKERRNSERLRLSIQIRVMGCDLEGVEFKEDTHTIIVNRTGARIVLKRRMGGGETVRIVDLENYHESDFRLVGRLTPPDAESGEWGVDCLESRRNIWGIDLPPPLPAGGLESGALLECRSCHQQGFLTVWLTELDVLESSGIIVRNCKECGKPTNWTFAEVTRRPRQFPLSEPVAPPVSKVEAAKGVEKRIHRRTAMKLPILVRNKKGEEDTAKTENVCKGGYGVNLWLDLPEGEVVTVVCPYTPEGENIHQKAQVRSRPKFEFGGRRYYGLRLLR